MHPMFRRYLTARVFGLMLRDESPEPIEVQWGVNMKVDRKCILRVIPHIHLFSFQMYLFVL